MQSKYFSPAFNSAIFDGPIRLYFAQFHESLALKIYFLIQQKWAAEFARAKDLSKATHANIMVMIYPTTESFMASMDMDGSENQPWSCEGWNQDQVIAMKGPIEEDKIEEFMEFLGQAMAQWNPRSGDLSRPELSIG